MHHHMYREGMLSIQQYSCWHHAVHGKPYIMSTVSLEVCGV